MVDGVLRSLGAVRATSVSSIILPQVGDSDSTLEPPYVFVGLAGFCRKCFRRSSCEGGDILAARFEGALYVMADRREDIFGLYQLSPASVR